MTKWADQIHFKTNIDADLSGGVGIIQNENSQPQKIYLGYGREPWNTGLTLDDNISFKNKKIYYEGFKPTFKDVNSVGVNAPFSPQPWNDAPLMQNKRYLGGYHALCNENGYMSFGVSGVSKLDMFIDGDYYAEEKYKVYHEGFKPTPDDIGASDKSLGLNNKKFFTVGGDANKYYPVIVRVGGDARIYGTVKLSISRGYNAPAPDTWNTATHKGALTLTILLTGAYYWAGNDQYIQVLRFNEMYSKMVAGMQMSTEGVIVWLRGGNAEYCLSGDYGSACSYVVNLEKYTDVANQEFDIREDLSHVSEEILKLYSMRTQGTLYDQGARVYSSINKPSPIDIGAKANEPTVFNLASNSIEVKTPTRQANQYYKFYDNNIGWAPIQTGGITINEGDLNIKNKVSIKFNSENNAIEFVAL